MLAQGITVGRYVVKRKLAEGGMAEIYLASAQGPEGFAKDVVLKVVRSFLATDQQFTGYFIDEARLVSKLNHANLVQIFDFGKEGDTYYLAMEYVRGTSLWELRGRCRHAGVVFPAVLAAEIAAQVARGLQSAHLAKDAGVPLGIVHRDVSPHNVLLSFDGAVKLTDFGIAKHRTSQTAPGMLKGKYAYMSPEQARGEEVDPRSDVFSLGTVLWELLTGGRLFEAASELATLRAVGELTITPPSRLNPDVPEALSDVVMKALARPLDQRFQSAAELERALATCVLALAKKIEDTSVATFLRPLYPDEIGGTPHSIPAISKAAPPPSGSTITVERPSRGPAKGEGEERSLTRRERPRSGFLPEAPGAKGAAETGRAGTEKMPSVRRLPQVSKSRDSSERETEQVPSMRHLPYFAEGEHGRVPPGDEAAALPLPRAGTSSLRYEKDSGSNPTASATEPVTAGAPPVPRRGPPVKLVAGVALLVGIAGAAFAVFGRGGAEAVGTTPERAKVTAAPSPASAPPSAPGPARATGTPSAVGATPAVPAATSSVPSPAPPSGAPPVAVAPVAAENPPAPPHAPVNGAAPERAKAPEPAPTAKDVLAEKLGATPALGPSRPLMASAVPMAFIEVRARPYASVFLNGKRMKDAEGPMKIPVKAGTFELRLEHPRRTTTVQVTVKPGETAVVPFDATAP